MTSSESLAISTVSAKPQVDLLPDLPKKTTPFFDKEFFVSQHI